MEGRDDLESVTLCMAFGFAARGLEILTIFDEVCAERLHRAVFLDRIAMRHIDRHRQSVAAGGKSEALAVIACGRRNDAGRLRALALEPIDINQPAAHLEGAGRRV